MTTPESDPPPAEAVDKDRQGLARNAVVNTLGVIAKALHPVFYVLVTRLFGTEVFGVFLLANSLIELSISFTLSGVQDGVLLFASRHRVDGKEAPPVVYQTMANAMALVGLLTVGIIGAAWTVGPQLIPMRFPQPQLADAVRIMVLALPAIAIPQFIVSATKSLMIMKYDVIYIHTLRPLLLIAFAVLFHAFDPSVLGLAKAYVTSNAVVLVLSIRVFRRHFSVSALGRALVGLRWQRELIAFAIPQNLNLTLTYFMASIGTLFLGAAGVEASRIAFYGTAAEIVRNLRQIRLVFSTAFSPVISRLFGRQEIAELEHQYAAVTRWVIILAFPMAFVILAAKTPLLGLFHPSYMSMDATFMLMLMVGAIVACIFGFTSNLIAMTGHSGWNLYNAMASATVSVILNAVLIPRYGLFGAAAATTLTTMFDLTIKTLESHFWLGVKLRWALVWRPLAAGVIACGIYGAVVASSAGDPAGGPGAAAVALIAFVVGALAFGVDPGDRALATRMLRRRRQKERS